MADIIVTDVTPRVQYTAGAGSPTVFSYAFPIFANTDLNVYNTPVGVAADDVTQILVYNVDYTVTNSSPPTVGGTITLTVGAPSGNIITIVRNQPDNRLNNYISGGLFQATDVNTDFDRTVFMAQQNRMYDLNLGIHYNVSDQPVIVTDTVLPLLGPNETWVKNNANTEIVAIDIFGGGSIVNTISGTANRITVTPSTGDVVVDIAATYVGQTSITTLGTITAGTWNASAIGTIYGGTGITSYTLGDTLYASGANVLAKLSGNITSGIQYLAQTGTGAVSSAPAWTTISGGDITGAALTKTDDTNVTMTLGGTPSTALLRAASMTLGWTGQLGLTRGGTAASLTASNGGIVYSTASAMAILSGTATANQVLLSGSSTAPAWSTATYPATTTVNQILYSSSANVIAGLATANSSILVTSAGGVPSLSTTLPFTLPVSTGGTGNTTFTAYSVICAGTTATGVFQNVSGLGTSGYVLTSNGAGALPTWQASAGDVTSIAGTANQIAASASTGAVTLSLVSNTILPGTAGVTLPQGNTAARGGGAGTIRLNTQAGVFESTVDGSTWATIETSAVGVISVSGTSNRITATPTTGLVVVDISASYVGQTSITTLGTIGTGVWQGSVVALAYGGTNANLTASNGGIFYSTASAGAILAGTATANQVLLSGSSTTPAWSTATYPATTTVNQLLYSSSANVIAGLATANSSILVTSGAGVPSLSTTLPFTLPVSTGGTGNTTFTAYSVICAGTTATGAFQNVSGLGSSGNVLTSNGAGALPTWQAAGAPSGGWSLIASATPSAVATSDFSACFSSSYDVYYIEFSNIIPDTAGAILQLLLGTTGPSFVTSGYYWSAVSYRAGVSSAVEGNTNVAAVNLTVNEGGTGVRNTAPGLSGHVYLYGLNQASVAIFGTGAFAFWGDANATLENTSGGFLQGTPGVYNSLRILFSSGNITSGTIRVYGIKNS